MLHHARAGLDWGLVVRGEGQGRELNLFALIGVKCDYPLAGTAEGTSSRENLEARYFQILFIKARDFAKLALAILSQCLC